VMDTWYVGRGWYSDGPGRTFDYYNSFAFHFYPLVSAHLLGEAPWRGSHVDRLLAYLPALGTLVADDGAPLRLGRSLTYRAAVVAPYSVALLTGHAPAWVLPELNRTMNHFLGAGMVSANGIIDLGAAGPDDVTAQAYSGRLASYWVSKSFIHLLRDPPALDTGRSSHDTAPRSAETILEPTGLLVQRSPGLARAANHGTYDRVVIDVLRRSGSREYTHLEYSSATAPLRSTEAHAGSVLAQVGRRYFERTKPLTVSSDAPAGAVSSTWLLRPVDPTAPDRLRGPVGRLLRRKRIQRALDHVRPVLTIRTVAREGVLIHEIAVSRTCGRPFRLTFAGLPIDGAAAAIELTPDTVTVRSPRWLSGLTAVDGFRKVSVATGLGPTASAIDAVAPMARSRWRFSGGGTVATRFELTNRAEASQ